MQDSIIAEILDLKYLIVTFIISGAILYSFFWFVLDRFKWKKGKVRLFSLLYGLDTIQLACIGVLVTRFIFVFYCIVYNRSFGLPYLVALCAMSVAIGILQKEFSSVFSGFLSSFAIYIIIYIEYTLISFYLDAERYWVVLVMAIMLGIFCSLYNIYSLISSYNHLISKEYKNPKLHESFKNVRKIKWQS